jgi:signal recognition particle subunit SRP54
MGPLKEILAMVPGMGSALKDLPVDEGELDQTEAIINSMTPKERSRPDVIDASRRRRIARGSGVEPQDVAGIVKSFGQVKELVRQMQGAGAFGGGGGKTAAREQMAKIDLFGPMHRKRQRSARKKKDRKRRSR